MGMGIGTAFGAEGAADALRQIIKARIEAQQRDQELAQQTFTNNRLTANDARLAEEHQANMEDRRTAQQATAEDRSVGRANTLADQIPAGAELAPTDQGVGMMQGGGRGSLLRGNMTLPSTQTSGGMTMPDDSGASIRGSLRSMSSPEALRSYTKLPSEKQAEHADTADAKVEAARVAAENRTNDNDQKAQDRLAQIQAAKAGRQPAQHYSEPKDVWNPKTGQFEPAATTFNTSTGAYEPVKGVAPSGAHKAAPGAAQEAAWTSKRTDAVNKLSIVDKSIDAARDLIGPGQGRVATFEQMLGNPDPRISDLKTKLLSIKDQVAGALTMSNRQPSPVVLKRFDELLGTQLTPESLHAATNALREMLGPNDASAVAAGAKADPLGIR